MVKKKIILQVNNITISRFLNNFSRHFYLQIKREISIMKRVRHPNVVRLHEVRLIIKRARFV